MVVGKRKAKTKAIRARDCGVNEGKQVHVCNDGLEQGLCRDFEWTVWDMNESQGEWMVWIEILAG